MGERREDIPIIITVNEQQLLLLVTWLWWIVNLEDFGEKNWPPLLRWQAYIISLYRCQNLHNGRVNICIEYKSFILSPLSLSPSLFVIDTSKNITDLRAPDRDMVNRSQLAKRKRRRKKNANEVASSDSSWPVNYHLFEWREPERTNGVWKCKSLLLFPSPALMDGDTPTRTIVVENPWESPLPHHRNDPFVWKATIGNTFGAQLFHPRLTERGEEKILSNIC